MSGYMARRLFKLMENGGSLTKNAFIQLLFGIYLGDESDKRALVFKM